MFGSLSRKAKVKPTYHPTLNERYRCHAAAEFAAAYYRDTGRALLHDAIKEMFHERRKERQKELKAMQRKNPPRPRRTLPATFQPEFSL